MARKRTSIAKKPVNTSAVEAVKAETVATATKAEEVKAEVKEEVKEEIKAAPAKKTPAKKKTVKKEIKVKTIVEYYGKQVEDKEIIAAVKKAWTKTGKKIGDIKTMDLYVKPEEAAVYYVINGTETGAVAF